MLTNKIRLYKSHAGHRYKSCNALHVAHMGVLDIESQRLHGLEGRLDLPALPICFNRPLRTIEAHKNLKFGHSIRVLDSTAGKIDIFSLVKE